MNLLRFCNFLGLIRNFPVINNYHGKDIIFWNEIAIFSRFIRIRNTFSVNEQICSIPFRLKYYQFSNDKWYFNIENDITWKYINWKIPLWRYINFRYIVDLTDKVTEIWNFTIFYNMYYKFWKFFQKLLNRQCSNK